MKLLSTFLAEARTSARDCPDENLLAGFAERTLPGLERSRVEEHLGVCAKCRQAVALAFELMAGPSGNADRSGEFRIPLRTFVHGPGTGQVEFLHGFVLASLDQGGRLSATVFRGSCELATRAADQPERVGRPSPSAGPSLPALTRETGQPARVHCALRARTRKAASELLVHVTDARDQPLAGVLVKVSLCSGNTCQLVTDTEGNALLAGVEPRQIGGLELEVNLG